MAEFFRHLVRGGDGDEDEDGYGQVRPIQPHMLTSTLKGRIKV